MENLPKLAELIDDWSLETPPNISLQELARLKQNGLTAEEVLDQIVDKGFLLHGSRAEITDGHVRAGNDGRIYTTDKGAIALLKAILSNKEANLGYDWQIDTENPLEVEVTGMQPHTIGTRGFVYLVNPEGFENNPKGSWQYRMFQDKVPILGRVEVEREDFQHPIYDLTGKKRIQ